MSKNNKYDATKNNVAQVVEPELKEETLIPENTEGLEVNSGTEIEPADGETSEGEFNNESEQVNTTEAQEVVITPEEDIVDDKDTSDDESDEDIEDTKTVPEVKSTKIDLATAMSLTKDLTTEDLLEELFINGELDLKLFASEIKDFILAYSKNSELEYNNGNRKLYNLLVRTLKLENSDEFRFKFDIINKLFVENKIFEPSVLLVNSIWTKSEKDLANFAQVVTIIEDLADKTKRQENKKRIVNLTNLSLDEKSIENIKKYYKL